MPVNTGTNTIADLLDTRFGAVTVYEYGMDRVHETMNRDLANWNQIVTDELRFLAEDTTDVAARYAGSAYVDLLPSDEFDRGVTGKVTAGSDVAFPLRKFKRSVSWTFDFMKVATVQEVASSIQAIRLGHQRRIYNEIRNALFGPTNYTFIDELINNVSLPVKRLHNADSDQIPDGPYGDTFNGATHTHYLANATLTDTALQSAIDTVAEHRASSRIAVIIAETNAAGIAALTNYEPLIGSMITPGISADRASGILDSTRTNNRQIGVYNGSYAVWTKPWAVANYALVIDLDGGRPLKRRQRVQAPLRGLRPIQQYTQDPLMIESFEAEFGLGVFDRSAAAILQFNNGTYQDPTPF